MRPVHSGGLRRTGLHGIELHARLCLSSSAATAVHGRSGYALLGTRCGRTSRSPRTCPGGAGAGSILFGANCFLPSSRASCRSLRECTAPASRFNTTKIGKRGLFGDARPTCTPALSMTAVGRFCCRSDLKILANSDSRSLAAFCVGGGDDGTSDRRSGPSILRFSFR
jgi:hypothetical protein